MDRFSTIYNRAVEMKGSAASLEEILPVPLTVDELVAIPDDRYLSEMTKCVFRSGFVWKIVESKWPGFEEAFKKFQTGFNARLSDEQLEAMTSNAAIIRNFRKIESVRANAQFVLEVASEHGSFGKFLADSPEGDVMGLLRVLKKRGSRLGGHTGQYFLRFSGKDTYIFSRDVVKVLIKQGIVAKEPTSLRDQAAVQDAFNEWREESGRPLCQISRIMAASLG